MLKFILVLFYVSLVHCKHEEYDGHSLYRVRIYDVTQGDKLTQLVNRLTLDFWGYLYPEYESLILTPLTLKPEFEDEIISIGANYTIETKNIKTKLDLEDKLMNEAYRKSNRSKSSRFGLSFDIIHRYAVVDRYLLDVATRYPSIARVVNAGKSVEGRDIRYLRISSNNFVDRNKPVVVIQSLLHAREWITLPVALWAIEKLVINVTEQDLIRDIDWIILPIANPDGYEFTHSRMRLWRKNRRSGFSCEGVDLNRNFDFNWSTASSNNPCSDTYHGTRAFSEPETVIIRNIIELFRNRIGLFLDVHSFGSLILYGFGDGKPPTNSLILNRVATEMARKIDNVKWLQNRNYRVGNVAQVLYPASGSCGDYAQAMIGNRLSYTFELPAYRNQNGFNGFLVEPAFIRQAGFETWEGIKEAARYVVRNKAKLYAQ